MDAKSGFGAHRTNRNSGRQWWKTMLTSSTLTIWRGCRSFWKPAGGSDATRPFSSSVSQSRAHKSTPSLRLRVTAAAESIVRSGHPWLFAESIREQNRAGEPGELAVIYDRNDKFLAIGLYDPKSPIRVRILHTGKPETLDREW